MAIFLLWFFAVFTFITNYEANQAGESVSLLQSYSPWAAIAVLAVCEAIKAKKG